MTNSIEIINVPDSVIAQLRGIAHAFAADDLADVSPWNPNLSRAEPAALRDMAGRVVGMGLGVAAGCVYYLTRKRGAYAEHTSAGPVASVCLLHEVMAQIQPDDRVEFLVHELIHHLDGDDDAAALGANRMNSEAEYKAHVGAFFNMVRFLSSSPKEAAAYMEGLLRGRWSGGPYKVSGNLHFAQVRQLLSNAAFLERFQDACTDWLLAYQATGQHPRFAGG